MKLNYFKMLSMYLVVFCLFSLKGFSQNEHMTYWHFGDGAALDFSSGSPVSISGSTINTSEGCLSYSHPTTGVLLMYSDGSTVWDRTNVSMSNGTGLFGDGSSSQSGVVVPKPGSTDQYYILSVDNTGGSQGVTYSVVDMTLAGNGSVGSPLGDVTATKNVLLQAQMDGGYEISEKIGVVRHCNGTDYWVVLERATLNATRYYIYHLSSGGF